MVPIFKCLICRRDIERSKKTFWIKKGHLLCSTCLDEIEKNSQKKIMRVLYQKIFLRILVIQTKKL